MVDEFASQFRIRSDITVTRQRSSIMHLADTDRCVECNRESLE
jgi:hypothetical protein